MTDAVRAALAGFESVEIDRQLHDVPPHEVWLVRIDGDRLVCKLDAEERGRAGVEGRVMRFADRHTSLPVPTVVWVGDDAFLTAYRSDAPTPGTVGDASWARVAGRALARFHGETASALDGYGRFTVAESSDGGDEGAAARLRDVGLRTAGHASPHEWAVGYVEARRSVLAAHGDGDVADRIVACLRDRPDALGDAGPPVCCHGWATAEHVAVRDGEVRCVVDFEHAMAAPGEFDLYRTSAVGVESEARTALIDAYADERPLDGFHRRRPYYRLVALVSYFESLYVQDQHDPSETADRARRLREAVAESISDLG